MDLDTNADSGGSSTLDRLIKRFVFELSDDVSDASARDGVIIEIASFQEKEVSSKSDAPVFTLANIIVKSEYCLLSDNETYRMRGMLLVARLLQKMGENLSLGMQSFKLSHQSLHLLVFFICKRLKDYHSLIPCLDAIFAIVTYYESSLDPNNGDILVIMQSIFAEINVQSYSQAIRQKVFDLLLLIFSIDNVALHLETHALEIIENTIFSVQGEKDPRCLIRGMKLISIIAQLFDRYLNTENAEKAFQAVVCYFPITFKPSANDTFGITFELLVNSLIDTLTSSSFIFFRFSLPYFLHQLRSDDPSDQGEGGKDGEKLEAKFQAFWALRLAIGKYSHAFLRESNTEILSGYPMAVGGGGGLGDIMLYPDDELEGQRGISLLMEIRDMIFDVIFTSQASLIEIEEYLKLDILSLNSQNSSGATMISHSTLGQAFLLLSVIINSIYSNYSHSDTTALGHDHNMSKSLGEIDRDTFITPLIKRVKEEISLNIATDSLHVKKTIVTLVIIAKSGRNSLDNNNLIIETIVPLLLQYLKSLWKLTCASLVKSSLSFSKTNVNVIYSSLSLPTPPSLAEDPNFDSAESGCCKSDSSGSSSGGGGCCGGGGGGKTGGGSNIGGKMGGGDSAGKAPAQSSSMDHSHTHDHSSGSGCCGGSGKSSSASAITRIDSVVVDIIENLLCGFIPVLDASSAGHTEPSLQVGKQAEKLLRDLAAGTIATLTYPFCNHKSLLGRCNSLVDYLSPFEASMEGCDNSQPSIAISIKSVHTSLFKLVSRITKVPIAGLINPSDISAYLDSAVLFSLFGDQYVIYSTICSINEVNKSNYKLPTFSDREKVPKIDEDIIESSLSSLEDIVSLAVSRGLSSLNPDYYQLIISIFDPLISCIAIPSFEIDEKLTSRVLKCLYHLAKNDEESKPGFTGFILLDRFLNLANNMITGSLYPHQALAGSTSSYSKQLIEDLLRLTISLFDHPTNSLHNRSCINYFLSSSYLMDWIDRSLSLSNLDLKTLIQVVIKNNMASDIRDRFISDALQKLLSRLDSFVDINDISQTRYGTTTQIYDLTTSLLSYVDKSDKLWSPKNKQIDSLIRIVLVDITTFVQNVNVNGCIASRPNFESVLVLLSSLMFKLTSSDIRLLLIFYQVEVLFVNYLGDRASKTVPDSFESVDCLAKMFLSIGKPLLLRSDLRMNIHGEKSAFVEKLNIASSQLGFTLASYNALLNVTQISGNKSGCLQETIINNIASILDQGIASDGSVRGLIYTTLLNEVIHVVSIDASICLSYPGAAIANQFTYLSRINQSQREEGRVESNKTSFIVTTAGNLSPFWKQKMWLRFSEILLTKPTKNIANSTTNSVIESGNGATKGLTSALSSTISSIWSHLTSYAPNSESSSSTTVEQVPPEISYKTEYCESALLVLMSLLSDLSMPLLQSSTVPLTEIALVAFKALEISRNLDSKSSKSTMYSKASSLPVMTVNCLSNLVVIDPSLLVPYISSIIPILVDISGDASSSSGSSWLRYSCLNCLCLFVSTRDQSDGTAKSVIPYSALFPHKKKVIKGLMPALNDNKRAVRMLAAKARNIWTTMK